MSVEQQYVDRGYVGGGTVWDGGEQVEGEIYRGPTCSIEEQPADWIAAAVCGEMDKLVLAGSDGGDNPRLALGGGFNDLLQGVPY